MIETTPGPKRAASEKSRRKIETSQLEDDPLWYKDALIYELHVRASTTAMPTAGAISAA